MSLRQDFRHGLRLLRRTPGFTLAAILVLALGIGANTAVFSLVDALVLQARPGRIDSAVAVFSRDRVRPDRYRDFSYPEYVDLRDAGGVFESLTAHTFSTVGIGEGAATKQAFAALVASNYFGTLGVRLAAGRTFTADEERPGTNAPVAIAAYAVWRRAGFDPTFVGSAIRVNGREFTVVGVTPRGFAGTMTLLSPEWWFPLGSYDTVVNDAFKQRASGLDDRANYALNLVGALGPGVSRAAAARLLDAVAVRLGGEHPETDRDRTFLVGGLPRMSVSSRPESGESLAIVAALLALMAALVLVVACLNLANLLLARGAARRREIAIRQALGGSRWRIVRQLIAEGLVLSTGGAAAGLLLGWWASAALTAWVTSAMPLGIVVVVEPSSRLILAAAVFGLFSTVCFALGPSWMLSRPALVADLKGEAGAAARLKRRLGVGPFLVVGQLAVSVALVAAGGLFVRGAINAGRFDNGFAIDHELILSLDTSMAGYDAARSKVIYRDIMRRVRTTRGVERASLAAIVPYGEFQESRNVRLKPGDEPTSAEFNIVGADYFATLGIPMLRGREFSPADEAFDSGSTSVIVDRPLARRLFNDADPLGRPILVGGRDPEPSRTFVVVGVVAETSHDFTEARSRPHVFLPTGADFRSMLTVHVRTAAAVPEEVVLATLRRELLTIDGRLPITAAKTMAEQRDRSLIQWSVEAAATIFSAFGLLALMLAATGVYGLRAYDVSRRTREIGIRMALGATAGDIARLVLREGVRTTVIGLAAGLLLAAGIGKLASSLLVGVSPFDPLALGAAASTLAAATLAASFLPARRAARVAPLDALRTE